MYEIECLTNTNEFEAATSCSPYGGTSLCAPDCDPNDGTCNPNGDTVCGPDYDTCGPDYGTDCMPDCDPADD